VLRPVRLLALAIGFTIVGAACSSDAAKTATAGSASASASQAPEDRRATAADVTAGLDKINGITQQLAAAGTDKAVAQALDEQIEPIWSTIEGTVKANDPDSYIAFEDAFAVLEDASKAGDAIKTKQGADSVAATVTAYLAKYPG
jgi:hypothetical protein